MTYRFSDLSIEQLREKIGKYRELAIKAEQLGNQSEVAINERKMQMAMAYMLNPEDYLPGEVYELKGDPGHTYKINYIEGVFAWGNRINFLGELYKEEAIPISLLGDKLDKK